MSVDPRGPSKQIVAVGEYRQSTPINGHCPGGCIPVNLECGHVAELNFTFSYKVGEYVHCFECGPHGSPKPEVTFGNAGGGG